MTTALLPFTPLRTPRSLMMWKWLLAGDGAGGAWEYLERRPLQEVWAVYRETIVQHHIRRRPGRRPRLWWRYDSPEPRRRLGGVGSPLDKSIGYVAPLEFGVPDGWRVHGDFFRSGTPIDPLDPPRFESEAKYLRRLGLLLPGERERLCPRDFWPELVEP